MAAMRVHHLNCATMKPVLPRLVHGKAPKACQCLICHVLLIETEAGLVLVDSGLGTEDVAEGRARLGGLFDRVARPVLDESETAIRQVEALGYSAGDVRHVICTHLDVDHAGGIADFPEARVHVLAAEHEAALAPIRKDRDRYRQAHWAHDPQWCLHTPEGEPWFGFECVRDLPGLPPEILMVPLLGHSAGHAAVAVRSDDGWLMHCGDAYFHPGGISTPRAQPIGLSIFEATVQRDKKQRRHNQARLRDLKADHGDEISLFSAHDPSEWLALSGGETG